MKNSLLERYSAPALERHFAPAIAGLKSQKPPLPVAEVTAAVVNSVNAGKVTILTGKTGSGKTLLANCELADQSDHQIVVLVPRRFLATNAADSIEKIANAVNSEDASYLKVGKEVGYAIGHRSGDRSLFNEDTKLVFATYGYALRSGLINSAKTIVCDEVHEAGIDTSLVRALLRKRMEEEERSNIDPDKRLRVVEMSATINAQKQAKYWEDGGFKTARHHAEGRGFKCPDRLVHPDDSEYLNDKNYPYSLVDENDPYDKFRDDKVLARIARDLIKDEGRKGIAIFRHGVGQVKSTAEELRTLLDKSGMKNVEVALIYGDMDEAERKRAVAAPKPGNVKILVGTNVIESGVNIEWLDSGISDGKCKVPYYRESGAKALVLEELPQWRIIQQMGRVNRFRDGLFVLYSEIGKDDKRRPLESSPEITRVSLEGLVMHVANYNSNRPPDRRIDPTTLPFDAPVDKSRLYKAKDDLQRLGLLGNGWTLTEKGEYVITLPLGAETGAMMWAAKDKPEIRHEVMELTAIIEVGGLREGYWESHGMDHESDIFDALKVFRSLGYDATEEQCANRNVSWKRYKDVIELVDDMHRRHDTERPDKGRNRPISERELRQLKQIMLHGSVNHLFEKQVEERHIRQRGAKRKSKQRVEKHTSYTDLIHQHAGFKEDDCSVASGANSQDHFVIGGLRELPARDGGARVIVQNITPISKEALCEFAGSPEGKKMGILTDIIFHRDKRERDSFTAKYCGRTDITINIPPRKDRELLESMKDLIGPAYAKFCEEMGRKSPGSNPRDGDFRDREKGRKRGNGRRPG